MGRGLVRSFGSTVAAPTTFANAPNVVSATSVVGYGLYGNASAFSISGVITLPTTDPNYARLKKINVTWTRGSTVTVVQVVTPPLTGTTVTYSSGAYFPYLQDGSSHSDTVSFVCENDNSVVTASPVTNSITVEASAVTSISSAAEVGPVVVLDPTSRLNGTTLSFVPVLGSSQVPQNVTFLTSRDNGVSFVYVGWQLVSTVGQALTVSVVSPSFTDNWVIAACAGAVGGDPTIFIPAASLAAVFPGVVLSSSFAVAGLAAPAATAVTNAVAGTFSNVVRADGTQYGVISNTVYTEPTDNSFFVRITVEQLNASHGMLAAEQAFAGFQVSAAGGQVQNTGILQIAYVTGLAYIRYRAYLSNRNSTGTNDFTNPALAVLQTTCWPGSAAFEDVAITVPAGSVVPVVPGNVTIVSATVDPFTTVVSGGAAMRGVTVKYTPPATLGSFLGVQIQIESPDTTLVGTNNLAAAILDGSVNLAGPKTPLTFGPFWDADINGNVTVMIPQVNTGRGATVASRVWVLSCSSAITNPVSTSPSLAFNVVPVSASNPSSGTAHTSNPTSVSEGAVTANKTNTLGGSALISVATTSMVVNVVPPQDPTYQGFVGIILDPDGSVYYESAPQITATCTLVFPTPGSVGTFTFYACGWDGNNINPLVPGITPSFQIALGTTAGTVNPAQLVQSALSAAEFQIVGGVLSMKGIDLTKAFNFSPTNFAVSGGEMLITGVDLSQGFNFNTTNFAVTGGKLTITGVDFSQGFNGFTVGGGVPKIQVTVGATNYGWVGYDAISGYGGAWFNQMFIGGTGPGSANANFYADGAGNVVANTILIGNSSGVYGWIGSSGGYNGAWFPHLLVGGTSPATANLYADGSGNVIANTVQIGNASGVYGWIGSSGGYNGAWFPHLLVGGTSPATANLYADSSGNVVANTVQVGNSSGVYGWIGTSGVYTGAWFPRLFIGGTSPATAKIIADTFGNVAISGSLLVGGSVLLTALGTGTLPSGIVCQTLSSSISITSPTILGGSINGVTIVGATITGTVSITSPTITGGSLSITAGPVLVNIDGTNIIKVSDTSSGESATLTYDYLFLSNSSSSIRLNLSGITWDNGGTFVTVLNLAGGNATLALPNTSGDFAFLTANGFSNIGTGTGFTGTVLTSAGTKNVLGGIIQN